jgi:hypothetical protein
MNQCLCSVVAGGVRHVAPGRVSAGSGFASGRGCGCAPWCQGIRLSRASLGTIEPSTEAVCFTISGLIDRYGNARRSRASRAAARRE